MQLKLKKKKSQKKQSGSIFMALGLLMMAAALGLVFYNRWDSDRAGDEAATVLAQLTESLEARRQGESGSADENCDCDTAGNPGCACCTDAEEDRCRTEDGTMCACPGCTKEASCICSGSKSWDVNPYEEYEASPQMPTVEIDGYAYIGVLRIPSLGISLPVMADWDMERLKVAPCAFSGSYYTDDLVLCGHNYARHFSPIKWIDIGADVYLDTADGKTRHYVVTNRENLAPTQVEEMIDSDGSWDLTLFTCTTGGQARCAVRCVEENGNN